MTLRDKSLAPNWNWHHSIYCDNDPCICKDERPVGTCQVCGRYTTDRICYAGPRCKELGGGEVM